MPLGWTEIYLNFFSVKTFFFLPFLHSFFHIHEAWSSIRTIAGGEQKQQEGKWNGPRETVKMLPCYSYINNNKKKQRAHLGAADRSDMERAKEILRNKPNIIE